MNIPEQIRLLLEKYQNQTCNAEEMQQLHDWLEQKALSGNQWVFRDDADKSATKQNIQGAVIAAMGEKGSFPGLTETGDSTFAVVQPATVQPVAVQPAAVQTDSAVYGPGRRVKLTWLKYAAVAASLSGCIWGLAKLTRTPGEMIETIAKAAPGKIEKLTLPDGSTVWLNDNTELAYNDNFEKNRIVELRKGEAFFDIKKDASHPFVVNSHNLSTTVLGTSFSVKMIGATKEIKISVVTGKVLVSKQKDTLSTLLPSQRLKYSGQKSGAVVDSVLTGEANGWINGDLFLENAALGEVIQLLQDHYKINVRTYRPYHEGKYYLHAKSDIPLQEMLDILNLLGEKNHVQFSLQEKTITIR